MDSKVDLPLLRLINSTHIRVQQLREIGSVSINGQSLDVAAVVAVARSVPPSAFKWKGRLMCSGRHGCEPIIERSGDKVNLSDSVNVVEDSYCLLYTSPSPRD